MKYFRLGLLIFGVGAIGSHAVLALAMVGILETFGPYVSGLVMFTSILVLAIPVGCCIWAGWVSVKPAGLRPWPAAVFGGGLTGLGALFAGQMVYWFLPGMHRPAHHYPHYPFWYVLLGWLSWLLWLAVPILLAYIGATQAHKRMNAQAVEDEEDGFDPEIDHEPDPVFDQEADSETPLDPE